jgi:acylphosphatase
VAARVRRRVVVRGRVQGVFFRDSCQSEAIRAGLGGWVRNRNDGAVEAVFEGDEIAVGNLVTWCRAGPPSARVDAIEVTDEPPEGLTTFRITGWS